MKSPAYDAAYHQTIFNVEIHFFIVKNLRMADFYLGSITIAHLSFLARCCEWGGCHPRAILHAKGATHSTRLAK